MAKKGLDLTKNPLFAGPSLESRESSVTPFREIPLAEIDLDPNQPRKVFNKEALSELASSIEQYGVLSPIIVSLKDSGGYRLIAGERRYRASKKAGLVEIPAIIDRSLGDDSDLLAKQLVENLQREDLSSMERSVSIGQLRDSFNLSIREIAKKLGISKSMVQRSLDVLSLPDDLQAALASGYAESKVLLISKISDRGLRAELLAQCEDLTRKQLDIEIASILKMPKKEVSHRGTPKSSPNKTLTTQEKKVVEDLQRSLGAKVKLLKDGVKKGSGKLVLDYYSKDDLDALIERLS